MTKKDLQRAGWSCAALWALASLSPAARANTPPVTITVGSLQLNLCNTDYTGYCGSIERPLDPTGAVPGTLAIGFEFYPKRDGTRPSLGTFLPQEGGPGYSSTGTRDAYLSLFGPLRDRRDVLIVDKRGTGLSGPIDCPALQASDASDRAAIAACARQLGSTASLYGSVLAAADVVAVLDALGIDRVDYYGDSYGTYFGQVMAAWHPTRLRSIVLDSAYPVRPPDPWFPTDWATARDGLNLVCNRSPSCQALGGSANDRLLSLIRALRIAPITGMAPDADGTLQSVTMDAGALLRVVFNAGSGPAVYRDLDAAVRAWRHESDTVPLLRLLAELDTGGASDPAAYSAGLYQAVICKEYPLFYRLTDARSVRRRDFATAIADAQVNRPNLFAPFTLDEGLASNVDITPLDTCLDWPVPLASYPQGDALPAHPVFPGVPTLVLSGDLDAVTSPSDAAAVTRLFPDVVHLLVPNLTHITAFSDEDNNIVAGGGDLTHCVSDIVRHFYLTLVPGDTRCAANVRPIRTVPYFAKLSSELDPPQVLPGNQAGGAELRIASSAAEAVGDAIARFFVGFNGTGSGLRGGQYTYALTDVGYDYQMTEVKWSEDVSVTGTIHWNQASGDISSNLTVSQSGHPVGKLDLAWNDTPGNASVRLIGRINGRVLRAMRVAP